MAYIPAALRRQVGERARGVCEYCQTQQILVIEMEVDHIVPEIAGGVTELENLCLACIHCNSHKRDHQMGIDPQTSETVPLFNPRTQVWNEHFAWSDDGIRIIGITSIGRATVERLKMNRDLVVQARERWVKVGWHPPEII